MAFRFHRRISLFPGIRLNLGKTGVSISAGVRGASVTAGKRGIYGNVGAPGTGMSYRTRLDKNRAHQQRAERNAWREGAELQRPNELQERVTLKCNEQGKLNIFDANGAPASPALKRRIWSQHAAQIHSFLESEIARINDDQALLLEIHHDTPPHDTAPPEFEQAPFPTEEPQAPKFIPKRWWHAFWKSKAQERIQHNTALEAAYREQHSAWAAAKEEHEQAQAELAEAFTEDLQHDREFQERVLESELQQLDWPRETLIDFELEQTSSGLTLHIDVDFPDPESFPSREASFSKNQKRLLIKNKSTTQQRKEYAQHVHGALFRVIGVAFVTLPNLSEIEIAGYRQIHHPATGQAQDEYIIRVKLTRNGWHTLHLEQIEHIDPIAALAQFELTRNMTKTGIFRAIEPE
ncbi:MAG: Protein of unknown function (DUF4236) [Idiomarinaceae bacterium HL-53]|nr:MAG: Protein of unknown function (DUF4236) [Idiomarinaceae bacterium HL-53]CUS49182.1 Protein of unknown function (DUF4236) [Idiomarinaceae bacterium HL-53]